MNYLDIQKLIERRKQTAFSGCLKITYQGKNIVASCIESNSTEAIVTKSEDYSYVMKLIEEDGYSGTVILEFLDGKIVGYAYTRKIV